MEKIINILNQFKVDSKAKYTLSTLSNGLINDTYLVSTDIQPEYILQRINTQVFTNVNAIIKNIDLVLPHLKDHDYQELKLVPSTTGKSFYKTSNSEVWRLMTFINESVVYNTTTNPVIATEAGKIIGKYHLLLQQINPESLEDTLPRFHDVHLRYEQFSQALSQTTTERIKGAEKAIAFAQNTYQKLKTIDLSSLPIRACHNDTKLNNILFSKTDKALCLIDLDTIMKGTFLYDFGDAIRTIANTAAEDEKDLSKINFQMELFSAFVDGLAQNGNFLNTSEKEFLPLGAVLMPYLHGIRALTDYLGFNKYYKVSYENQNLDRCYSLFKCAELALEKESEMKKVIQQKLN